MSARSQRCSCDRACRRHAHDEHERDFHESFSAFDSRSGDRCRSRHPGIVWAQSADATLRGKAPASTAVTAKNVATGVTRRTQSSADGNYTLPGLPPGTYRVDAGPGTETTVTLSVASTATLDLVAASGAVEAPDAPMQEVTVDGPASQRGAHLRSRHDGLATPDRNRAADHAQLPRVRRHRSGRRVRSRRQRPHVDQRRRAEPRTA